MTHTNTQTVANSSDKRRERNTIKITETTNGSIITLMKMTYSLSAQLRTKIEIIQIIRMNYIHFPLKNICIQMNRFRFQYTEKKREKNS